MFEITALGFAVVPERLCGRGVDEEPAHEGEEAEAHYERNDREHDAFGHGAGLVALLFGGVWLVFGFGEFDVYHVVVIGGSGSCGRGGSDAGFVVLLADEVAGAFASIHDGRLIEGLD
jgi:hypothetical protein